VHTHPDCLTEFFQIRLRRVLPKEQTALGETSR